MSEMRSVFWALLPPVAIGTLFVLVLAAPGSRAPLTGRTVPNEPYVADRCTWYCHNHTCRHRPLLPAWLTSDAGAFGRTIRGLQAIGRGVSRDPATGYGIANLFVFCFAWPVGTYALWLVATRARGEAAARYRTSSSPREGR